jgi:hypothetical protein
VGHTPTPWRASSSDPKAIRRKTRFIGATEREEDTAFIVRAVNAHDDLVAALKEARDALVRAPAIFMPSYTIGKIDTALAKAEGRS